jgi:hypothetical protein
MADVGEPLKVSLTSAVSFTGGDLCVKNACGRENILAIGSELGNNTRSFAAAAYDPTSRLTTLEFNSRVF